MSEGSRGDEVLAARRAKLAALREAGIEPFALRFPDATPAGAVREAHGALGPDEVTETRVRVAGRIVLFRRQGRLTFATLRDRTGEIQLFISRDELGDAYEVTKLLDLGDWVGAEGAVMTTKKGELSVRVASLTVLTKTLRPLPEKFHGLRDVEARHRQRYLDLIANPEVAERVRQKAAVLAAIRRHLDERGFVEVETPVLQTVPGGGMARPFLTHHETLDIPLYLRIALELFHKRLLVGGLERVYEIGRTFRNEGVSTKYNPEFTMLEAYQAYADYEEMMDLVQGLVLASADALGSRRVTYQGVDLDLDGEWPRRTVVELASEAVGRELSLDTPIEDLRALCRERGVEPHDGWGAGKLVLELFEKLAESQLMQPTLVKDFPREVSPLARPHRDDPRLTEHFDLIMGGMEIAPAYSELTDPDEQRARFELQREQASAGEAETHPFDEEFLVALEHGMPPAGGLGLGIDRLLVVLTDAPSIREVILFPTLRPEAR
jgi:lysyl-tRNA synthetase class 2